MSEPAPRPALPTWIVGAVLSLLAFQVGLLWMQGSLLERQHGDLQSMRQDVQDLTESLEQFQGAFDQGTGENDFQPTHRRFRGRRLPLRVRLQEEEGAGVRKELEDQRKSEKEAVAKARDVREKLSIEENMRKADEKAKIEAATHKSRPLLLAGVGLVLLVLVVRSWMRRRG